MEPDDHEAGAHAEHAGRCWLCAPERGELCHVHDPSLQPEPPLDSQLTWTVEVPVG